MMSTKRQLKRALQIATSFNVARYLMSNAHGRWDGVEKAQTHRALCEKFVAVYFDIDIDSVHRIRDEEYETVHEHTQKLTGHLDTAIGFPLNERPDYDKLEPMFFDRFYELAFEALAKKGV